MLESIADLKRVKQLAKDIELERDELALQLQTKAEQNDAVLTDFDSVSEKLVTAAQQISSVRTVGEIAELRLRYGPLKILDQLEALFVQQASKTAEKSALDEVQSVHEAMDAVDTAQNALYLEQWRAKLKLAARQAPDHDLSAVFQRFNDLVRQEAQPLMDRLESELLASSWDSEDMAVPETEFRELSTKIYSLNALLLPHRNDHEIWNFQCIAHNFKIKFVYHFVNESVQKPSSVEVYFRFLEKYLDENLFKCINIFSDPTAADLTENFVHQQFINHILMPIREKVNTTLTKIATGGSNESLKTLMILISQIFIIDDALLKKHFYDGVGLVAIIPGEVLDTWLSFEIESSANQFRKIAQLSLDKSGHDLSKLLENLYAYFEPFFGLEYNKLMDYKLKTTTAIFMDLPHKYRDFLFKSREDGSASYTDEAQFEQTLWKLQNLLLVRKTIDDFGDRLSFILLTNYLNAATSSAYPSVFSDVLRLYDEAVLAVRDSIIHRLKKMMNVSLRNYFKVNEWANINSEPQQCSAELVTSLNLLVRLISTIDKFDLTRDISLAIKSELLNILVHYMMDYVVNLNKFSELGLRQLELDFIALKDSLNFSCSAVPQNAEEGVFRETLEVLKLKYKHHDFFDEFISKKYVDRREFSGIRDKLKITYSTDSELANALYRLL
ncbi:LADA_0C01838g1_1 [Lachancea dasiensis]|uniref:LADA_0C01838g1_1 n=1 Tax=Lachancea dasiensis TaxID=1072105 RepID=A0A1G4IXQ3_9SACH|nr:LADA_0C01838g1_1 [Lachancea dasiensis]